MFRAKTIQPEALKNAIIQALSAPKWLEGVRIGAGGEVTLIIIADPNDLMQAESRRLEAESAIRSIEGVHVVNAVLTAERATRPQSGSPVRKTHNLIDRR